MGTSNTTLHKLVMHVTADAKQISPAPPPAATLTLPLPEKYSRESENDSLSLMQTSSCSLVKTSVSPLPLAGRTSQLAALLHLAS